MVMRRRVMKQINDLELNPVPNIHYLSHRFHQDDSCDMHYLLVGPPDSLYAGYQFQLKVHLHKHYPFKPPRVQFLTHIYHPSVHTINKFLCHCAIAQLDDRWSPAITVPKALSLVADMLSNPSEYEPACGTQQASTFYAKERAKFNENCGYWLKRYGEEAIIKLR